MQAADLNILCEITWRRLSGTYSNRIRLLAPSRLSHSRFLESRRPLGFILRLNPEEKKRRRRKMLNFFCLIRRRLHADTKRQTAQRERKRQNANIISLRPSREPPPRPPAPLAVIVAICTSELISFHSAGSLPTRMRPGQKLIHNCQISVLGDVSAARRQRRQTEGFIVPLTSVLRSPVCA